MKQTQKGTNMKTGLVLEGGAIRTIFSSGATDAMLDAGILFDYIVGVSAGIAYGVSYASRQVGRNLEILEKYVNDKRYMGVRHLINPKNRSYFNLEFIYSTIPNGLVPFDYDTFAAYPGDIDAVVTNLRTGRADYKPVPRRDDKFEILQATCAMPLLFQPFCLDGNLYLDGGIADPIPFRRAFSVGCDKVVVVLTRERSYRKNEGRVQALLKRRYRKYPEFQAAIETRSARYNQTREELFALEAAGKVFLLNPEDTQHFSRTERDLQKIRALYKSGYDHASQRMAQLKEFLTTP